MNLPIPLIATISAIVFCIATPAWSQHVLQGAIQHTEALPQLDKQFQVGRPYDAAKAPVSPHADDWYVIPPWLAGNWIRLQGTRTLLYKYADNSTDPDSIPLKGQEKEVFGWQTDSRGDIWSCRDVGKPVESEVENSVLGEDGKPQPQGARVLRHLDNQIVSADRDKVVLKTSELIITLPKTGNHILSVNRAENIRTLSYLGDDLMSVYSDIRTYDDSGKPLTKTKEASIFRRIHNFTSVDVFEGRNLRMSFSKFLERTGQVSLIPDRS